jgi:hypothetical protein
MYIIIMIQIVPSRAETLKSSKAGHLHWILQEVWLWVNGLFAVKKLWNI